MSSGECKVPLCGAPINNIYKHCPLCMDHYRLFADSEEYVAAAETAEDFSRRLFAEALGKYLDRVEREFYQRYEEYKARKAKELGVGG